MTVNKGSFYLILNWHRWMKSFIMKPRDSIGLHTYYHDWGTDQTRNHDINNGCIVTLLWQYSSLRNRNNRSTVYPKKYAHGFSLLCFVVVIHWLIFPYPSGLLHWQCGNLTIAPVPAKQPWWIWINTSCEFIMNDCITTTKQSTTKPCAYFLGYTVSIAVYTRLRG